MKEQEIITLAKSSAFSLAHSKGIYLCSETDIVRFANLVVHAEREACAKIVERDLYPGPLTPYQAQYNAGIKAVAAAIRSRT